MAANPASPILITCSNCGRVSGADPSHAGKQGECPYCQTIIPIPVSPLTTPYFLRKNKVNTKKIQPRKKILSERRYTLLLAIPIVLALIAATTFYFYSVLEDWTAVVGTLEQAKESIMGKTELEDNEVALDPEMREDSFPLENQASEAVRVSIAELQEACKNELVSSKYTNKQVQIKGILILQREPAGLFEARRVVLVDPKDRTSSMKSDLVYGIGNSPGLLEKFTGLLTLRGICDGSDTLKQCRILTSEKEMKEQIASVLKTEKEEKQNALDQFEQKLLHASDVVVLHDNISTGKYAELVGEVKKVKKQENGKFAVITSARLRGKDVVITCVFRDVHRAKLEKLVIGSTTKIRGKVFWGFLGDVMDFDECVLVE